MFEFVSNGLLPACSNLRVQILYLRFLRLFSNCFVSAECSCSILWPLKWGVDTVCDTSWNHKNVVATACFRARLPSRGTFFCIEPTTRELLRFCQNIVMFTLKVIFKQVKQQWMFCRYIVLLECKMSDYEPPCCVRMSWCDQTETSARKCRISLGGELGIARCSICFVKKKQHLLSHGDLWFVYLWAFSKQIDTGAFGFWFSTIWWELYFDVQCWPEVPMRFELTVVRVGSQIQIRVCPFEKEWRLFKQNNGVRVDTTVCQSYLTEWKTCQYERSANNTTCLEDENKLHWMFSLFFCRWQCQPELRVASRHTQW